jgi:hypothetical protein
LDKLPGYGSRAVVNKRDVSMLDLSALTAKTGDEFAMFTKAGRRLIVRGNSEKIPLSYNELSEMVSIGYRWSGHTHPGIMDVDLTVSKGDLDVLELFGQISSTVYNAAGKYRVFRKGG